jgi:hypothetical protein
VVLDGKGVDRGRAGEESKIREGSRGDGRKKCLHQGDDGSDVQSDRWPDYLYRHMGRGTERAVCVGEIPVWMDVYCLDGSARNDQRNTQESQEEFPGTLVCRIGAFSDHCISNIAHEIAELY